MILIMCHLIINQVLRWLKFSVYMWVVDPVPLVRALEKQFIFMRNQTTSYNVKFSLIVQSIRSLDNTMQNGKAYSLSIPDQHGEFIY
jgi:hypothetical protein